MPISVRVSARVGGPLRVVVRDNCGIEAAVEWAGPLEAARKHALSREAIAEQFGRLGDTPFELGAVEIELPEAVMAPRSVLNDLRREAVAKLKAARAAGTRYEIVEPDALERVRAEIGPPSVRTPDGVNSALTVLVRTLDQIDAVLACDTPVGMIYCDFEDTRRYREAVPRARAAGVPIGLATLRVLKPGEEGFLKPILHAAPDAVLVRNLASLDFFRAELPSATLVGDFSLNVANEITADLLIREGLARLVPSYDLNWEQLAALVRRSDPLWYEAVIHQHMPMFHMEHCVFAAFLSEGKDFRDCGRPCDRHKVELRDRVGAAFPVTPDAGCRNTVFNSVAQSAAEYMGRMKELGLRRFRVDLLRETPEQIGALLRRYRRVVSGQDDGRTLWRELRTLNQLGVTRGTLQLV